MAKISQNQILFIDNRHTVSEIVHSNKKKIRKFLGKKKTTFIIPEETLIANNLKQKIQYQYPEKSVHKDFSDDVLTIEKLNEHLLDCLHIGTDCSKKSYLIFYLGNTYKDINIKTEFSYAHTYCFIDITESKSFDEFFDVLKKYEPLVSEKFQTKPPSFKIEYLPHYFYLLKRHIRYRRRNVEAIELQIKLSNPKVTLDESIGFRKIYERLPQKINHTNGWIPTKQDIIDYEEVDVAEIYYSIPPKEGDKTFDSESEKKFQKMMKKASEVKDGLEDLVSNGFEELAIMAIVKGLKLKGENQVFFEEQFKKLEKALPVDIDRRWLHNAEHKLSILRITKDYRIFLDDYDIEIKLNPLHKALYFVFLENPDGIYINHLSEHKQQIMDWYLKLSNRKLSESMEKSIEDLCNPMENSVYEKISRIRKEFVSQMNERLARIYYIDGYITAEKKIKLSRNFVIWE
ncbi:MAG: hypothetical protein J0L47_03765 [Flavobacteriales bacterium]|nr:hypothetical protein [Flavobacteriales bacterium]MCA0390679.1 hypothetical protein [Bacteroidota bacterium]